MLALFPFPDERLIGMYRVGDDLSGDTERATANAERLLNDSQMNNNYMKEMQYMKKTRKKSRESSLDEDGRRYLRTEFPMLSLDKCMVVTDRNVYLIELRWEKYFFWKLFYI